uniref:Uncharacterized protein n=1 Tax=Ciona savignyi TaxID=51511 RepID=H2Z830_CIOSA
MVRLSSSSPVRSFHLSVGLRTSFSCIGTFRTGTFGLFNASNSPSHARRRIAVARWTHGTLWSRITWWSSEASFTSFSISTVLSK